MGDGLSEIIILYMYMQRKDFVDFVEKEIKFLSKSNNMSAILNGLLKNDKIDVTCNNKFDIIFNCHCLSD